MRYASGTWTLEDMVHLMERILNTMVQMLGGSETVSIPSLPTDLLTLLMSKQSCRLDIKMVLALESTQPNSRLSFN